MQLRWKTDALVAVAVILLGQIGLFYLAAYRCAINASDPLSKSGELKALVVSDVHLLGKRRRTWIERQWIDSQIASSLQAAVRVHQPNIILVLGDQLDEGGYPTSDGDWEEYVTRFKAAFQSTNGIETIYLMGNHDSAFGRYLTSPVITRHERAFGPSNHRTTVNGHDIIYMNTMALDSDITKVEIKAQAASFLQSLQIKPAHGEDDATSRHSTIFLTHLPLFREDDMKCGAARLREHGHVTYEHPSFVYETHHHVLSKELSNDLLHKIQPDIVLSGHTHAWCEYQHAHGGPKEFTIPAFSWGQRPNPSYALLYAAGPRVRVFQCSLPREGDVFLLYGTALSILILRCLWRCVLASCMSSSPRHAKKRI